MYREDLKIVSDWAFILKIFVHDFPKYKYKNILVSEFLMDGISSKIENIDLIRRSIVAKCSIRQGEIFSELNLLTKRPGTGISPMDWDRLIGSKASRDFEADELSDSRLTETFKE